MKKLLPILICLFIASCESGPKYEILKYDEYDTPAKSQTETRLLLTDSLTKKNVTDLLNSFFTTDTNKTFKYHTKPSHVFIYVYKDSLDYKRDGSSWIGMMSRVGGVDNGIELKEDLK